MGGAEESSLPGTDTAPRGEQALGVASSRGVYWASHCGLGAEARQDWRDGDGRGGGHCTDFFRWALPSHRSWEGPARGAPWPVYESLCVRRFLNSCSWDLTARGGGTFGGQGPGEREAGGALSYLSAFAT